MAQLPTGPFNSADVPAAAPMEPIPAGWYSMLIEESEMKPTSDKQGQYLELTLKVIDGEFVNRKVWARLNLQNKSEKAMEIAYQQLSAICQAVGVPVLNDSQELHNRPLRVRVKYNEGNGQYGPYNDVSGFKAMEGNQGQGFASTPAPVQNQGFAQQQPAQEQAPQAQPAASGAQTPPWKR